MNIKEGLGGAIGHHGELLQGVFEGDGGSLHRGLVSLPCRHLVSKARFVANGHVGVSVMPQRCEKARRAAELALDRFSPARANGQLTIETNIPIGRGMGSSTADVLSSILAVFDYLQIQPKFEWVMQIAVNAETACDSTLFSPAVTLFAQREGFVIEAFRNSLPRIDLISIDTVAAEDVNTVELKPAAYNQIEIETFRSLRAGLRNAIEMSDIYLLGRVATASTRINNRFLENPDLDRIEAIGARRGAVGLQASHSGTVLGLMFDPSSVETPDNMGMALHELSESAFNISILHI
ncbi:GHMP kinase [Paraburkholderia phytofirmans]